MTALRLLKAARAGDEAEIEALIARGVKGTRKQLVEAARAGETDVVEVLLRSGTRGTRPQLEAARYAGESALEEALLRSGAAGAGGRLLAAQRRGDSAEIEALKREGAPPQADFGRAIVDNDVELARALLVLEIEALKREDAPSFQRALERALQVDDVAIVQTLLAAGADPNAPHSAGHGEAIGTTARSPAALAALIDAGADLNAPLPHDFGLSIPFRLCNEASNLPHPEDKFTPADQPAIALAMLKLALARGMNPNARYRKRKGPTGYIHGGETLIEHVARGGWQGSYPVSTEAGRRALVATIEALIDAGADTSEALARFRRSAARGGPALDSSVMAALERTPRAPGNAPLDSAAAFEAERRAHPPPPAAPASHPDGGFKVALLVAGGLALLLALVTCGARPAPAGESEAPGWRFMEAVDGDTLAFTVDALPPALARVLVRVRGVDTPETRRPKCDWERAAGERARAFTASALASASTIALADLAWGKYGGRVLAHGAAA